MTRGILLLNGITMRLFVATVLSSLCIYGLYVPGYDVRLTIHVCSNEERSLLCDEGEFLWVHSVVLGYSRNDSSGCTIAPTDCMANLTVSDYWRATSYQTFSGITVPVEEVTCEDSIVQSANYILIMYSCISETRLNSMDICSEESRTLVEGHLTNPGWARGVAAQQLDCTCRLEPTSGALLSAKLSILYTDLPEQISCGERTSIEDPEGNVLLHHCSPGWLHLLATPNVYASITQGTTSLHVRFVKDHTNDYPRMTKIWYGFEATAVVRVTCGPTSLVNLDSDPTTTVSTPRGAAVSEATIVIIVSVGCGTFIIVAVSAIIACVMIRRKRFGTPPTTIAPHTAPPVQDTHQPPHSKPQTWCFNPAYTNSDGLPPDWGYLEVR